MTDFSYERKEHECLMPAGKSETKTCYPTVSFDKESVDALKSLLGGLPEVDEEYLLTGVTLRCTGVRHDEYGKSASFSLVSADSATDEGEAEMDDEPAEEARPKKEMVDKASKKVAANARY